VINKYPKIVAVSGSPEKNGSTSAALRICLQGAASFGAEAAMIELSEYNFSAAYAQSSGDPYRFRNELNQADGIIFGTPEYHNSISGLLKTAVDFLAKGQLKNKFAGLVGVAGGGAGAVNALNCLMLICRSLHCWVSPNVVSIASAGTKFDRDGNILDKNIGDRLFNLGYDIAKYASLINPELQEEMSSQMR
jgi:NAD(P)H-dependent FMN reductase